MLGKALKFLCTMLKISCKLLKSSAGTPWSDYFLKIPKQIALEEADEPKSKPNEKTIKFSHFSDMLRPIEAGINAFEETDLKE